MSTGELACTYAALLLHDDGQEVSADKIATVLKAAGVTVEPFWPTLFAKALKTQSLDGLITNVGAGGGAPSAGGGGGAAAPAAAAAAAPGKKEEPKKEEKKVEEEEEDGDFGMSLFD